MLLAHRRTAAALALGLGVAATASGCVYSTEKVVPVAATPSSTVVVTSSPAQRTVSHPDGRWELRGEGTTTSPYYWVWIPAGTTVTTIPAPPPLPR